MLGRMAGDGAGRGREGRGWAIAPPYASGPPAPRTFDAARRLVALVWLPANAILLAVAALRAYLAAVTALVEGVGFSLGAWLAAECPRAGASLIEGSALALLLYPINALVFGWSYHPEPRRTPRSLSVALVALVALSTLAGALQSLYIHVVYS